jgi:hypothetical protein
MGVMGATAATGESTAGALTEPAPLLPAGEEAAMAGASGRGTEAEGEGDEITDGDAGESSGRVAVAVRVASTVFARSVTAVDCAAKEGASTTSGAGATVFAGEGVTTTTGATTAA